MRASPVPAASLLLAGLLAACPRAPGAQEAVQDAALERKLTAFAEEVLDGGHYTPTRTLIEQLARKRCQVKPDSPSAQTLDFPEAARRVRAAVACVSGVYKCDKCKECHCSTATGFFIGKEGVLATCYHVVDRPTNETMVVLTAAGTTARVLEVLAADRAADVAILRVEGEDYPVVPLQAEAPEGTSVGVWSHPDGEYFFLSQGIVSRRFLTRAGRGQRRELLSITADFAQGSSGGPVFDLRGNVVGMACTTRSLYYQGEERDRPHDLQMVLKNCASSSSIMRLLETE